MYLILQILSRTVISGWMDTDSTNTMKIEREKRFY